MRPWNKLALRSLRQELVKVNAAEAEMIEKLQKPVRLDYKGFLSHMQMQSVESKMTRAEEMNTVIDYLQEMEDKYFESFCKLLEQSNFEGKANMLRQKAEEYKTYFGKFAYKQHTCMCSNIMKTSCM